MGGQRRSAFVTALSGLGGVQPTFDTPIAEASIDTAWNVLSDSYAAVEKEIDRILTCDLQGLADRQMLRRILRWTFDYEADPHLMGIHAMYQNGVAAAPTGVPTIQRIRIFIENATAGTFQILLTVGSRIKSSAPIPYNTDATTLRRTLENLTAIGRGNVTVTLAAPGDFNVDIVGNLLHGQIALPTADITNLGGAGKSVTITQTTAGVERQHQGNQISTFQPPPFSAICGYRGSSRPHRLYKSLVSNTLRFAGSRATPRITANWGVAGSGEPAFPTAAYALPPCLLFRAARFLDCDLIIDGVSYQANDLWRDFELTQDNGLITDEDAYTGPDEDIHRLERADFRPFGLNVGITGEEGDDIYNIGDSLSILPVTLRIGRPGRSVSYVIPAGSFSLQATPVTPDGSARRSKVNLNIEPTGDPASAFSIILEDGQAETFLTPQP